MPSATIREGKGAGGLRRGGLIAATAMIAACAVVLGTMAATRAAARPAADSVEGTAAGEDGDLADAARAPGSPVVIVLDASSSMAEETADGRTRMEVAADALGSTVQALPDDAEIGVLVFGTGTAGADSAQQEGCRDVETLVPLGVVDREALSSSLSAVTASGFAPIGHALTTAAGMLPTDTAASIVLVSDGRDTCAPPPACEVASRLREESPLLSIHVVGVAVDDDEEALQELACIGGVGGGGFVQAATVDRLAAGVALAVDPTLARGALTGSGFDDAVLGMRLDEVLAVFADAEVTERETRDGAAYVVIACAWGRIELRDDRVTRIVPDAETATAEGLHPGADIAVAARLYGPPVETGSDELGDFEIYPAATQSRTGYQVYLDGAAVERVAVCACIQGEQGAAEMSTWEITIDRIGPIGLGDDLAQVQRAVAWLAAPVAGENFFESDEDGDGTADYAIWVQRDEHERIILKMTFNEERRVKSVQIGGTPVSGETDAEELDGATLPSVRGIRIGDTASTATHAFPGGSVFVQRLGADAAYTAADREGHLLTFSLDGGTIGDAVTGAREEFSGAEIRSIEIEDGTRRESRYDLIDSLVAEQEEI